MSEIDAGQQLSHDKIQAEITKLIAEAGKLNAETSKINNENRYYPLIVGATVTLAIVAIVKIFF